MSDRPGLRGLAGLCWSLACHPLNSVALSRPEYLRALATSSRNKGSDFRIPGVLLTDRVNI